MMPDMLNRRSPFLISNEMYTTNLSKVMLGFVAMKDWLPVVAVVSRENNTVDSPNVSCTS